MLSTYTVNTLSAANTGADGVGSLRYAIDAADQAGGNQTITFDPSLTENGPATINFAATDGPLIIDNSSGTVTIDGPGADRLTVDANQDTGSSVFKVSGNAVIEGLTIAGGAVQNGGWGGGIDNSGQLTVNACWISGNSAGQGGGIANQRGNLQVVDSTISGNTAGSTGGGIYSQYGATTVVNSTISGNVAPVGGGMYQYYSSTTVTDSTISANKATASVSSVAVSGIDNFGTCTLNGTIVADNLNPQGSLSAQNLSTQGAFTGTDDLIGDNSGSFPTTSILDRGGADLSPLDYYGGPTETMPPAGGSAALNTGGTFTGLNGAVITTDQQGNTRAQNSAPNIGAVQNQNSLTPMSSPVIVVTTLNDETGQAGELSLRDAITQAETSPGDRTISFDPQLTENGPAVLNLNPSYGPLMLDDTAGILIIDGPGANLLTIDADNHTGVFENDGISEIIGLSITGGQSGYGGGIFNLDQLTISASTISGNTADSGGGVYNRGILTVTDSTITGNQAMAGEGKGGGIYNYDSADLTISECTITGNTASSLGGGIYNYGYSSMSVTDSTIDANVASSGGDINSRNRYSQTIQGTIITGSSLTGGDLSGNFVGTNNLIDDGTGGLTGPTNIQPVSGAGTIAAMLAPLGYYGGTTQTMPPLPNSPALGMGANFTTSTGFYIITDQRGLPLPAASAPDIGAVEAIAVPTGLDASVFSSTQINLGWTDNSAVAVEDMIYESTDGGATFNPLAEVNSVGVGSANNYQATGLVPGADYQFYVVADAGVAQSTPSASVDQPIPFETPTLDVEGTGTVVEGQPYELDLTANYPDGEAGAPDHWLVDWNDGPGGTSNVSTYTYAAGADPTQPLTVTHTFAPGITSPNVLVTAVDSVNGQWIADPQPVTVTPIAPALGSVTASGNSITVNWANSSSISTGTTVLLSTDGTNFFEYGAADAGATTLTISDLTLDTQYSVQVVAESVNGESSVSGSESVNTPYIAPILDVIAPNPATQGQQYTLDLSANYAAGTPQDEMVAQWDINWGDGSGPQTYSSSAGVFSSPTGNYSTSPAQIVISAVEANGTVISYPTQTVDFEPPPESTGLSPYGPNPITIADGAIPVGGEQDLGVYYGGSSSTTLTYHSTDPSVMQIVSWTDDGNGNRTVRVLAVSYGEAEIYATDGLGSLGVSGTFGTVAPGVTVSTPNETEGATYTAPNIPEFIFGFGPGVTSVTNVTLSYNTLGSTLPASLMGQLGSGSVTIDANTSETIVPFVVPDDGVIAPLRAAVVNLLTPGNLFGVGDQTAIMNVVNTDVPTVTMGPATGTTSAGSSNNAVIPLDPQGDNSKLTDIHLNPGQVDGTILSWSLTWNANDFVMWGSNSIGKPGTDLGSWTFGNYGAHYDSFDGTVTFSDVGKPPTDIYGQCMEGSSNWDTTWVDFGIEVYKAATPQVSAQIRDAVNSATGTAKGLVILNGGSPLNINSDFIVATRLNLTALWEGPGTIAANATVTWTVQGTAISFFSATVNIGRVYPISGATLPYFGPETFSFYWSTGTFRGSSKTVTCLLSSPATYITAAAAVSVQSFRPVGALVALTGDSSVGGQQQTAAPTYGVLNNGQPYVSAGTLDPATDPTSGHVGYLVPGIKFYGFASEPLGKRDGNYEWVQTISNTYYVSYGPFDLLSATIDDDKTGLDTSYPYLNFSSPTLPTAYRSFNGSPEVSEAADSPTGFGQVNSNNFGTTKSLTMYLMYQPGVAAGSSDWVPLEKIQWFFSGTDHNGSFTVKISPPGYGSDTTTFPEWSQVVNGLQT